MLGCFTQVFVQDERSRGLLNGLGMHHVTVAGDTRFDRVLRIAADGRAVPLAKAFQRATDTPVLIAGSTWPADEDILAQALRAMRTPPRLILVPHEPTEHAVKRSFSLMPPPVVRWTEVERMLESAHPGQASQEHGPNDGDPLFARTLLMDTTGILARTYQHADMAYVGGGFGDGIHSILEAAAWGIPVIFGPRHTKVAEAQGLIDADGGVQVNNAEELTLVVTRWMQDPQARMLAGLAAQRYVRSHAGATARIIPALFDRLSPSR
jgi:3-deoxy-D-manno-octulosonic-acid transferase